MIDIFSDENRRNPYPLYDHFRSGSPLLHVPPPFDGYLIFDYATVKLVLTDHVQFSSAVPAPRHWFIFQDPPVHSKLRALISKAFTPRTIANLEPSIRQLSRQLIDVVMEREQMDLASDYSVPLPMTVIARMIGIPEGDWPKFKLWSDVIVRLSYARSGGVEAEQAGKDFGAVTQEMSGYLAKMIEHRKSAPADDLLTRLIEAEVDGERLSHEEILGFFQLLVVGGQETTTNLINNAMICLLENSASLLRLRDEPGLIPNAIEEVLRYRSPLQWVMRTPRVVQEIHGQKIAPGKLILPIIGSANRDPAIFPNPNSFDITRDPNPHVAFGHGIHACLGAALARMEGRIALGDLLTRLSGIEFASKEPWPPRKALHVHGPANLLVRFTAQKGG